MGEKGSAGHWSVNSTIIVQEVWHGRLWSARPMQVIEDGGSFLVLWCPRGTRWKASTTPRSRSRAPTRAERLMACLTLDDWVLRDAVWDVSKLVLVRPGDWHAIWVSWRDSGEDWGWYINLQRPFRRTEQGLQTMDLMLDVLVERDRSWRWKDEDEFDALVTANLIDAAEAARVRDTGQRVISDIEANAPPFSDPWHSWRPDPAWPLPELPQGWDRIE